MEAKTRTTLRTVVGKTLLPIAAVQYLVLEAVAAAAWHHPTYSYAVDFISDLGNPVPGDVFQGRTINSPMHLAMDAAFIAQGTLFITAAIMLYPMYRAPGRRLGRTLLTLAILHGIGVILVGFFHESSAALTNGVIVVHSIGAATTIVTGNVIAITVAIHGRRLAAPAWHRVLGVSLGVLGLAAFVLLQADHTLYVAAGGVPERIAVYTILVWEAATGIALPACPTAHITRQAPQTPTTNPARPIPNRPATEPRTSPKADAKQSKNPATTTSTKQAHSATAHTPPRARAAPRGSAPGSVSPPNRAAPIPPPSARTDTARPGGPQHHQNRAGRPRCPNAALTPPATNPFSSHPPHHTVGAHFRAYPTRRAPAAPQPIRGHER
jgi:hypothetical membrane protein